MGIKIIVSCVGERDGRQMDQTQPALRSAPWDITLDFTCLNKFTVFSPTEKEERLGGWRERERERERVWLCSHTTHTISVVCVLCVYVDFLCIFGQMCRIQYKKHAVRNTPTMQPDPPSSVMNEQEIFQNILLFVCLFFLGLTFYVKIFKNNCFVFTFFFNIFILLFCLYLPCSLHLFSFLCIFIFILNIY